MPTCNELHRARLGLGVCQVQVDLHGFHQLAIHAADPARSANGRSCRCGARAPLRGRQRVVRSPFSSEPPAKRRALSANRSPHFADGGLAGARRPPRPGSRPFRGQRYAVHRHAACRDDWGIRYGCLLCSTGPLTSSARRELRSASRSQSPSRLTDSTSATSATEKIEIHHMPEQIAVADADQRAQRRRGRRHAR